MLHPKDDPFFEKLKADIQEGIDQLDRGEFVTHEEVWAGVEETLRRVQRERSGAQTSDPESGSE